MRRGSLLWLVLLTGCPGSSGGIGDLCSDISDCSSQLQCVAGACEPLCVRAPDCGAGYSCNENGFCEVATGQLGEPCASEVECAGGLACELDPDTDAAGNLMASCTPTTETRPSGATCTRDADCHNNLCALGRCVDLCTDTRDCVTGTACVAIPRVEASGAMFHGCLQAQGTLAWTIPVAASVQSVSLPIPESAQSIAVTLGIDDPNQEVAATALLAPDGSYLIDPRADAYANPIRFQPALGQATLTIPSSPATLLVPGAYTMTVSSLRPPYTTSDVGTATPRVTAVLKLDTSVLLDLHFYFLDFDEFPCSDTAFGNAAFSAHAAQIASFFQNDFLGSLRGILASGGVALGEIDYTDLRDHPDLDGPDVANAGELLSMGSNADGINVFFVRSLSPAGLQAYGPNPGPAGLANTPQSGVIIPLDTLCYRSWTDLSRVAGHELARYMGLYDNVEIDQVHTDPIDDSDQSTSNLMFYSELGGIELSPGQRTILSRSAVLR
jgi:hypothetical protein